jgi:hypothetical protein
MRHLAFLDGVELQGCVAANEEEGWADVYEQDEKGRSIVEVIFGKTRLKVKRVSGRIELKLKVEGD